MSIGNTNAEIAMLFIKHNSKKGQSPSELKAMYNEAIEELKKYDYEKVPDFTL